MGLTAEMYCVSLCSNEPTNNKAELENWQKKCKTHYKAVTKTPTVHNNRFSKWPENIVEHVV